MVEPTSRLHVRPLAAGDELARAWQLAGLAFGASARPAFGHDTERSPDSTVLPEGQVWYGAFQAGQLIGIARELCRDQWWGGRLMAAADVSSVAVLPEARGGGAARALMRGLLNDAHERGAAVSALYPTASQVYRASGWAVCGALRSLELPASALPTARPAGGTLTVRAADPSGADQPAISGLYTRVASVRDGMLSRESPAAKPATGLPSGIDGITLVESDGNLVGYASWIRGSGYRADAVLDVPDLIASSLDAARELVGVLAGWRSVTPTIRLRVLDFDAASLLIPVEAATTLDARPWMHRPVDVARAVGGRGWPQSRHGQVAFHLHDPVAPWNDGAWLLQVSEGEASLKRTESEPELRLDVAGFALLYCGAATPAMLLETPLLYGPAAGVSGLELLSPGIGAQLLDYF